jgi:hypothetical protein
LLFGILGKIRVDDGANASAMKLLVNKGAKTAKHIIWADLIPAENLGVSIIKLSERIDFVITSASPTLLIA